MYIVKERYQWRSSEGVKWTNWFTLDGFPTEEQANNYLKEYKKRMVKDELQHEFRRVESD